jgi:hypothetical protein
MQIRGQTRPKSMALLFSASPYPLSPRQATLTYNDFLADTVNKVVRSNAQVGLFDVVVIEEFLSGAA